MDCVIKVIAPDNAVIVKILMAIFFVTFAQKHTMMVLIKFASVRQF